MASIEVEAVREGELVEGVEGGRGEERVPLVGRALMRCRNKRVRRAASIEARFAASQYLVPAIYYKKNLERVLSMD